MKRRTEEQIETRRAAAAVAAAEALKQAFEAEVAREEAAREARAAAVLQRSSSRKSVDEREAEEARMLENARNAAQASRAALQARLEQQYAGEGDAKKRRELIAQDKLTAAANSLEAAKAEREAMNGRKDNLEQRLAAAHNLAILYAGQRERRDEIADELSAASQKVTHETDVTGTARTLAVKALAQRAQKEGDALAKTGEKLNRDTIDALDHKVRAAMQIIKAAAIVAVKNEAASRHAKRKREKEAEAEALKALITASNIPNGVAAATPVADLGTILPAAEERARGIGRARARWQWLSEEVRNLQHERGSLAGMLSAMEADQLAMGQSSAVRARFDKELASLRQRMASIDTQINSRRVEIEEAEKEVQALELDATEMLTKALPQGVPSEFTRALKVWQHALSRAEEAGASAENAEQASIIGQPGVDASTVKVSLQLMRQLPQNDVVRKELEAASREAAIALQAKEREEARTASNAQQAIVDAGAPSSSLSGGDDTPLRLIVRADASVLPPGEARPADFEVQVVPSLSIADLITRVARKLALLSASGDLMRELLLVAEASGAQLSATHSIRESGVRDDDLIVAQGRHGPWRKQQKVIVVPEVQDGPSQKAIEQLRNFTQQILSKPPPLPPEEGLTHLSEEDSKAMLCHILASTCNAQGREALFYDSTGGSGADVKDHPYGVADGVASIPSLGSPDVDMVEILFDEDLTFEGLWDPGNREAVQARGRTLNQVLADPTDYASLKEAFRWHLAAAFDVQSSQIANLRLEVGSLKVSFNASGWSVDSRSNIVQGSAYLYMQFRKTFRSVYVHPLFKQCAFDLALFDARGDDQGKFNGYNLPVGFPKEQQETYYQPPGTGWRRFGLKVVGKYVDGDEWLTPANYQQPEKTPNLWWRAYHATSYKGLEGITPSATTLASFAEGHQGAIKGTTYGGKLGADVVYVTPHLEYGVAAYSGVAELKSKSRTLRYVMVFQCAVKPGFRCASGYPGHSHHLITPSEELVKVFEGRYKKRDSEWALAEEHVRPYGILLTDASEFEKLYPGVKCGKWTGTNTQQVEEEDTSTDIAEQQLLQLALASEKSLADAQHKQWKAKEVLVLLHEDNLQVSVKGSHADFWEGLADTTKEAIEAAFTKLAELDAHIDAEETNVAGAQADQLLLQHDAKSGELTITLMWSCGTDLDIHCTAPSGETIYFSHKKSKCGGELDVDMTYCFTGSKAVENIRWMSGAPSGKYTVRVVNYSGVKRAGFKVIVRGGGEREFDAGHTEQELRLWNAVLSTPQDPKGESAPSKNKPTIKLVEFEFTSPAKPIKWLWEMPQQEHEKRKEAAAQLANLDSLHTQATSLIASSI